MNRTSKLVPLQLAVLLVAGCSLDDGEAIDPSPRSENSAQTVSVRAIKQVPVVEVQPVSAPSVETDARVVDFSDDAVDHARLGREAWEQGDAALAARELHRAVARDQASDYDHYLYGLALFKSGELEQADAVLTDASWKLDDFARAPVNLARVRLELDDLAGARKAIARALEIDPGFGPAHNVNGRILMKQGIRDEASAAFQRATELTESDPWPHNNLGYLMLISGREADAITPLERATEIDAQHAIAWHNLALAREAAGDLHGALVAAKRADELAGDSESVYRATATRIASLKPAKPSGATEIVQESEFIEQDDDASETVETVALSSPAGD